MEVTLSYFYTTSYYLVITISGSPLHRENRENRENCQKNSLSVKTQSIWEFCQNTGKRQGMFVCSSCKLSDSKECCDIYPEISFSAGYVCQVSF